MYYQYWRQFWKSKIEDGLPQNTAQDDSQEDEQPLKGKAAYSSVKKLCQVKIISSQSDHNNAKRIGTGKLDTSQCNISCSPNYAHNSMLTVPIRVTSLHAIPLQTRNGRRLESHVDSIPVTMKKIWTCTNLFRINFIFFCYQFSSQFAPELDSDPDARITTTIPNPLKQSILFRSKPFVSTFTLLH